MGNIKYKKNVIRNLLVVSLYL